MAEWMKTTICPVCKEEGFNPDCDEVDIGVGVLEGNHRGLCRNCGEVCPGDDGEFVGQFPYKPGRLPAMSLKDVPFPECASKCALVLHLGASECDSMCPFKFPKES